MNNELRIMNKKIKEKNTSYFNSGFTLLELLVVISIIGILIALGTVSYSVAQRKSRDAKRKGDVKSLQNGFEQYYSQNGRYPQNTDELSTVFSGSLPLDPRTGNSYDFGLDTSVPIGENYCVCATLEITNSGNASGRSGTTCNFSASGERYFCAQNLQ